MTPHTTTSLKGTTMRAPKIIISEAEITHIEALAEGAMQRNLALADRLLEEISRARIVKANKMPPDVITIGSVVTYRDEATSQTKTVTLVYPENADIMRQQISVMTPIGVALLGLSKGAEFYWDTRGDQRRLLTVIEVSQPTAPNTDDSTTNFIDLW